MKETFTGRYIVAGPRVYIRPDCTFIKDTSSHVSECPFHGLPSGVFVWVNPSCVFEGVVPGHWVDIKDMVDIYLESFEAGLMHRESIPDERTFAEKLPL